MLPDETSEKDYVRAMVDVWGDNATEIIGQYPLSRFAGSPQSAFIQADADGYVICPSHAIARMVAQTGESSVYMYEYAHLASHACDPGTTLDVLPNNTHDVLWAPMWASHGADQPFQFDTDVGPNY